MRFNNVLKCMAGVLVVILSGCSGGGSGADVAAPAGIKVSGVASKGLIKNGTVTIYAIVSGAKGNLLATAHTDNNGFYTADVGTYTGPILVEAYGSYVDEATGSVKTIQPSAPLRAALDNLAANATVAVTPLTEIAVQKAASLTPAGIKAANTAVSQLFGLSDIVGTTPVDATAAALQSASAAQRNYTLALAAVSQMALLQNEPDAAGVIHTISSGISGDAISAQVAGQFVTALTTYVAANPATVSAPPAELLNVGKRTMLLKLTLHSTQSAGGISATVDLPGGVAVKLADPASGRIDPGVVTAATTATFEGRYVSATATEPARVTFAVMSVSGIAPGEFAVLRCDVDAGVEVTPDQIRVEGTSKIVDLDGKDIAASLSATAVLL